MKSEKRKEYNLKQLIIEVPTELHNEIKSHVAIRNISMKRWIMRTLIQALKNEDRN